MKRVLEIFGCFLWLGCTAFGGPVAHMAYFQRVFVQQRQWLDEAAYARLLALSQFLPGPSSSQLGFAIGLQRAGLAGGVAAFLGFTLPPCLLLLALAWLGEGRQPAWMDGVVQGLKLLAAVVVLDAVVSLFRRFCTQPFTVCLALGGALVLWLWPGRFMPVGVLLAAAVLALLAMRAPMQPATPAAGSVRVWPLLVFAALLLLAMFWQPEEGWGLFLDFYAVGSLVFGGGHVVLPLLQQSLGESLPADRFLLGYAAAQAVPGPMFSLGAFLGAELWPANRVLGAVLATAGLFLPGFLLVLGLQPVWENLLSRPRLARAMAGVNAAVVGLLLSALMNLLPETALRGSVEASLVVGAWLALVLLKCPVWLLALFLALAGWLLF